MELSQEVELELAALKRTLRPLADNPDHAEAVFNGIEQVEEILNLLDEAKTLSEDSGLDRALFVTRNFWAARQREQPSNEWVRETGKYLLTFPPQAEKWARTLFSFRVITPIVIAGIHVRNATYPQAVDDLRGPITEVAKAIKDRRWGALLRSYILVIESSQMPAAHRGHAGAMYRTAKDDILLVWPSPDGRNLVERIAHEFGHRLWFMFLHEDNQKVWTESWTRIKDEGGGFVTEYAASNPKEDFAEVFAYWVLQRPIGDHEVRLHEVEVAERPKHETTAVADGRGRTNYAIGMGWPTIPVTFLTERRAATHQRTMREPNDTIAVGLSWESPEGTRRITGERDMPDGRHVYLVLTGENPLATLLSAADVRFDIRRDTAALANRTAGRAQKQREREQDAERADLDGFEQKFSPLQRGKVIERLTQQMRVGGVFASRRDHIRRLVDAGYIVISSSGERRLANPNMTSYYTEKDLTKTALDYAEYLETK